MRPTPFRIDIDLAPMPFEPAHRLAARQLKDKGLLWRPHVGCFVWDESGAISVPSPFPDRVYFVLNLGHFLRLFGTVEHMVASLVWLPTWHQARLICRQLGIEDNVILGLLRGKKVFSMNEDLKYIYGCICTALEEQKAKKE